MYWKIEYETNKLLVKKCLDSWHLTQFVVYHLQFKLSAPISEWDEFKPSELDSFDNTFKFVFDSKSLDPCILHI